MSLTSLKLCCVFFESSFSSLISLSLASRDYEVSFWADLNFWRSFISCSWRRSGDCGFFNSNTSYCRERTCWSASSSLWRVSSNSFSVCCLPRSITCAWLDSDWVKGYSTSLKGSSSSSNCCRRSHSCLYRSSSYCRSAYLATLDSLSKE